SAPDTWYGSVNLANVSTGTKTLIVTENGVSTTSVIFIYDFPPAVNLSTPILAYGLLDSTTTLVADCTDTDAFPCASLEIRLNSSSGPLIASATAHINQVVSLAPYFGQTFGLCVTATD